MKMVSSRLSVLLFVASARGQTSVAPTVVSMEVLAMKVPLWDTFPLVPELIYDPLGARSNTSFYFDGIFGAGVTPNAK